MARYNVSYLLATDMVVTGHEIRLAFSFRSRGTRRKAPELGLPELAYCRVPP